MQCNKGGKKVYFNYAFKFVCLLVVIGAAAKVKINAGAAFCFRFNEL